MTLSNLERERRFSIANMQNTNNPTAEISMISSKTEVKTRPSGILKSDACKSEGGWDRSKPSPDSPQSESLQPEGGWGWVICLTSLMVNGAVFGLMNSYGIIFNFLMDSPQVVGDDRSLIAFKTSWVGSVYVGTFLIINFFAGLSCDRFGIRQTGVFGATVAALGMLSSAFVQQLELLYLTFGVVLGIGAGFLFSPSLVILGHYFKDRIGLASALVFSGSPVFTIIFSFTLKKLLNAVNLKFTFLILCGLYLVMILGALSWKPLLKPKVNNTDCTEEKACGTMKRLFKVDLLKNRKFLLWILAVDIALSGHYIVYVHLIKYSTDRFPDSDGNLLLTIMAVSTLVGRLILGRISDLPCVNKINMHQATLLLRGVTVASITFIPSFPGLAALISLIGVFEGAIVMLLPAITIDTLGPHAASRGLGLLYGSFAIPVTLGSPIAGFLYDKTGGYTAAFIGDGCFRIAAGLLMCFLCPKKKMYKLQEDTHVENENSDLERWTKVEKMPHVMKGVLQDTVVKNNDGR